MTIKTPHGAATSRARRFKQRPTAHALTTAALVACVIAAGPGCSSAPIEADQAPQGTAGSIGLQLTPGVGVVLNTVNYSIIGPNSFARSGAIDVSNSPTLSAQIGGLPPGTGYTITLTATSTDGKTDCLGSANFDVAANTTTNVPITLRCVKQKNNGSVIIGGTLNVCPSIDNLVISPLRAPVGTTIALDATASDLDSVPAPLAYTWTTTGGTLVGASTAHATLICTAAGTPLVTLTVSDGDPGPNCPATQSFQVTCAACGVEGATCDDGNACTQSDVCHASTCSGSSAPVATPCAQGGGTVCDGNGACVDCVAPTDCPGVDTSCSHRTCVAGTCATSTSPYGGACSENGGTICDGTGSCIPFTVRVARVGAGIDGGALGLTAAPVFIEARNVADGSVVGSPIALPTAVSGANQPLTVGGLAVTDAQLSRSADEHYLVIPGYAAAPGSANPVNNVSFARVIARIDVAGNVDTSTVLSGAFIAGNIRSAVSSDGNTFWAAGGLGAGTDAGAGSGGIWTIQRGTIGGTQLSATPARSLGINGGQLYMSGDAGAMLLLATVGTGLPMTPAPSLTPFTGMPGGGMGPWGFVFFDLNAAVAGIDTAYVASEVVGSGDAGAALRGIQKWTYNGTSWSLSGTLSLAANVGFRSITGLVVGATPTLIASTADGTTSNRLVVFVDDGATAPRVLATSTTNTFFRGVSLPPR